MSSVAMMQEEKPSMSYQGDVWGLLTCGSDTLYQCGWLNISCHRKWVTVPWHVSQAESDTEVRGEKGISSEFWKQQCERNHSEGCNCASATWFYHHTSEKNIFLGWHLVLYTKFVMRWLSNVGVYTLPWTFSVGSPLIVCVWLWIALWAGHFYLMYTTKSVIRACIIVSLFEQALVQWFISLWPQKLDCHTHLCWPYRPG